jgi:hypothetical protein
MKKALAAFALVAFLAGCATTLPCGAIITDTTLPVSSASGEITYNKVGTSKCRSILGLVAWGDASIKAAAENGKVTKVQSVDFKSDGIFGVYGKYTTGVYGKYTTVVYGN